MRFAALLVAVVSCLNAQQLRVGRAAVRITPPAGIPMAGYYSVRLAEGTHDDLYSKAIVLEQDGARVALVACDLVAIEDSVAKTARQKIEQITGIPGGNVMISATHSHTGPLMREGFLSAIEGPPLQIARKYLTDLPNLIARSVEQAKADLQPARASAGIGQEGALSFNRRFLMKGGKIGWNPAKMDPNIIRPLGPIDPDVPVVYFETPATKPLASYVNFAMHLDTVGGALFSADYAYPLSTLLGKLKGPDMLTLFTIGTAGNINHRDVQNPSPQKGFAEAERIAGVLAGEVLKTYSRLKLLETAAPQARSENLKLDLPAIQPGDAAKARQIVAKLGKADAPPFLDQVNAFKVLDIASRVGRGLEAEVQVIALGNQIAWVGLPGEIFVELGAAIKKGSPFPHTIIAELANGLIGYVPNRTAYAEGAYEVVSARCAAGSGEALAEAALRLLHQLYTK